MRNRIVALICLAVLSVILLCPLCVHASAALDPSQEAELTLHYQKEGQVFSDLHISIYRVAEAFSDGTYELIAPYNSYPINIHGITIQEQWNNVATTLDSYIVANQLESYRQENTDENGMAVFADLETGLYFVSEVVAENNSGTYVFNQFMVYLPTLQQDGSFDYTVEANPKCVNYVPKNEYRVTKLWQDSGKQTNRPDEITVDIYKDGTLWETQILDSENNWSYVWYVPDDEQSKWTVVEHITSDAYTVAIQNNGNNFSLINTHKSITDVPDSPQTGDTSNMTLYIMLMCISGIALIVFSMYRERNKEK